MPKQQQQRERSRPPRGSRAGGWSIAAVAILAVGAVVALIWLGQAQPEGASVVVPTSNNVKGDPGAPVEIEVWADFQCPACRQLATGPARQLDATSVAAGRAKVVFRHMAFLGPESVWAAEAAECAGEQGQFWAYHDKLYAEQAGENRGAFSKDNLKRFAAAIGLDQGAFNACLDDGRYSARVRAETEAGRQKGVRATPTLFVQGQKIEGVPSFEQLRQMVDSAAASPVQGPRSKP